MADPRIKKAFNELIPGTNTPVTRAAPPAPVEDDEAPGRIEESTEIMSEPEWTRRGKVYVLHGSPVTLYPIGALAEALGYKPATVRKWEANDWLPRPRLRGKTQGTGRRRLYSKAQIEIIVKIAEEEGLLDDPLLAMSKTRFPERVREALRNVT